MNMKKVLVGMPAYNEGKVIGSVIKNLQKEGFENILVVDDCSNDNTYSKAKTAGAKTLRHVINRGAGGATSTIIEYAKRNGYDYLILMDSDGQHTPKDAKKLLKKSSSYDIVIGSRLKGKIQDMPIQRRIANFVGSFITWFFFGLFIRDSQSGFKVLNKKTISSIKITFDTFEFCSEMIGEIKRNKLTYCEVPITVLYTDYSMNKGHGQNILNGFKMISKFIFK